VHFAVTNLALVTLGAEAEAVLGTNSFVAIYVLSSAAGVLATVGLCELHPAGPQRLKAPGFNPSLNLSSEKLVSKPLLSQTQPVRTATPRLRQTRTRR
jgi:membrane associated rhomboid family serine protease